MFSHLRPVFAGCTRASLACRSQSTTPAQWSLAHLRSERRLFASESTPRSQQGTVRPPTEKAPGSTLHEPETPGQDAGEMKEGKDNVQYTFKGALFTCAVALGCYGYYEYLINRHAEQQRAVVKTERIGKPKLGGPFELVDRKGVPRTDEDFKGQYLLIYFGFSFCPDICPQEMEKQTRAIELLDAEFGPVCTPVFITVDPARDTPAQVDDYLEEFHPRLVGLTGTAEQVKKVSRAYRVYFNEDIRTRTSEEDYLIDHSIIHYFMGKDGKFLEFFGKNMTAQEMKDKMKLLIMEDKSKVVQRKQRQGVSDEE